MFQMSLQGMEALTTSMAKVVDAVDKDKLEPIYKEGAKKLQKLARVHIGMETNRKTGNLMRSPKGKLMRRKLGYPVVAIAAIDRKIAPHAHLVQGGHGGPHPALPKDFWSPVVSATPEVNEHIARQILENVDKAW